LAMTRAAISRAAKAEQTRQLVLDTARRLFTERGYDATSLQMIADEVGLTKAAVYYHFPTKIEILRAIIEVGLSRMEAVVADAATQTGRRARSRRLIEGFIDVLISTRHVASPRNSDPAVQRELDRSGQIADLQRRGLQVLFGDTPTAEQRVSFLLVLSVPEIMTGLDDLGDDDLRQALVTVCLRLQRGVS
jgi:AcrR family transcriptional regulator